MAARRKLMKRRRVKDFLINVYSLINEIAIWFVFSMCFVLAVCLAYVVPKCGITCLLISIAFTTIPRIHKQHKKEEE